MPDTRFHWTLLFLAAAFTAALAVVVVPPLIEDDLGVIQAFRDGFANPYASGFALDTMFTFLVLTVWVVYEAQYRGVRRGWIALVVCLVPGVAAGLATYLLIRHQKIGPQTWRRR
jgi:hypothetical protein